jgi:hypothetical protein
MDRICLIKSLRSPLIGVLLETQLSIALKGVIPINGWDFLTNINPIVVVFYTLENLDCSNMCNLDHRSTLLVDFDPMTIESHASEYFISS